MTTGTRDILTVSLAALTVQADAIVAQLGRAAEAGLTGFGTTAAALHASLGAVTAAAREASVRRRTLAAEIAGQTAERDEGVAAVAAWQRRVREVARAVTVLDPQLRYFADAVLEKIEFRARRLEGTRQSLASTAPALVGLLSAFPPSPIRAELDREIHQAPALLQRLNNVAEALLLLEAAEREAVQHAREGRAAVQSAIRQARRWWTAARALHPHLPPLDLTYAIAEAGRTKAASAAADPAPSASADPTDPPAADPSLPPPPAAAEGAGTDDRYTPDAHPPVASAHLLVAHAHLLVAHAHPAAASAHPVAASAHPVAASAHPVAASAHPAAASDD